MGMAELAAVRRASAPLAVPIAVEENGVAMMAVGGSFTCPQLSPLRDCHVYDERPIICRLYGVVEDLPCAWGCVPERWLTRQEAAAIIEAAVTARRPQGSADG